MKGEKKMIEKKPIKDEGYYDPYEEIANAIVIQACNDYKKAYKRSLRKKGEDGKPDTILVELEEFFRSNWYKTLTEVDGEYLMERLKNEVLADNNGVKNPHTNNNEGK